MLKVKAKCGRGVLIPPGIHYASELFEMSECVDQHPFYGRCIGFHVSFESNLSKLVQFLYCVRHFPFDF